MRKKFGRIAVPIILKREVILISIWVILLGILGCGEKRTGVVARVNNQVLTGEELDRFFPEYDTVTFEQKKDFVRRWIDNELIYQEAKRRRFDQNEDLKQSVRDMTKDLVIVNFLQKEIGEKIFSSEREAREFYQKNKGMFKREEDEVCASEMLLPTKEEADSAVKRIRNGESFSKVAAEMSIDLEARETGGDKGCFQRFSSIHPDVAEQAFSHRIGEVTKPFQTEWGWHILFIRDKKKKGTTREFELVKDEILNFLDDQKRNEAVTSFLDELRKKAKIERYGWADFAEGVEDISQED